MTEYEAQIYYEALQLLSTEAIQAEYNSIMHTPRWSEATLLKSTMVSVELNLRRLRLAKYDKEMVHA